MAARFTRRHNGLGTWARATTFAVITLAALWQLSYYSRVVAAVIALLAGGAALLTPGAGVLVIVTAIGIPLVAADLIVGAVFLVLGFSTIAYLAEDDARSFLVIGLTFCAIMIRAEWAVVVVAGCLFGAGDGAIVAFVACLLIEVAGLLIGERSVGTLATGGTDPVVKVAYLQGLAASGKALTFAWLPETVARIAPAELLRTLGGIRDVAVFAMQPFAWAIGAAVAGSITRSVGHPRRRFSALAGAAAGVALIAAISIASQTGLGGPVPSATLAVAGAISLVAAVAAMAVSEWVFVPELAEPALPKAAIPAGTEDADVDDLLRMIASAEEELTSKHTVRSVVMITDMKSFSRITQERGSVLTAKLVQRHRDLCLPIIASHSGRGKSSGGDGLVAAFDSPREALLAAIEIQQTLDAYNASRPGDDAILIRVGVAEGEIVLDKGGKPFLGDALNLAARVMGLADGGQVFTTRELSELAGEMPFGAVEHGAFRLKNISTPVELVELMWKEGQRPARPATTDEVPPQDEGAAAEAGPAGQPDEAGA